MLTSVNKLLLLHATIYMPNSICHHYLLLFPISLFAIAFLGMQNCIIIITDNKFTGPAYWFDRAHFVLLRGCDGKIQRKSFMELGVTGLRAAMCHCLTCVSFCCSAVRVSRSLWLRRHSRTQEVVISISSE